MNEQSLEDPETLKAIIRLLKLTCIVGEKMKFLYTSDPFLSVLDPYFIKLRKENIK